MEPTAESAKQLVSDIPEVLASSPKTINVTAMTVGVSKRASQNKSTAKKKHRVKDESRWVPKERKVLLTCLEEFGPPKSPEDFLKFQRHLPKRSVAEIESYFQSLTNPTTKKTIADKERYSTSVLKRWIESCDDLTGIEGTCSDSGDGHINYPHPAIILSDFISESIPPTVPAEVFNSANNFSFEGIHWFVSETLKGENPFEQWHCKRVIESAVLLEALQEVTKDVESSELSEQHRAMFYTYREAKAPKLEKGFVEDPFPETVYKSKFLNPYGLKEEVTQCIPKRFRFNAALEEHIRATANKKKAAHD